MALPDEGTALAELPSSVITSILWALDPGDCVRLSLASMKLRHLVVMAERFWEDQCRRIGWRPQQQASPELGLAAAPAEYERWARYYSARMLARWRIRALVKKLVPFFPRASMLAMNPGASLQDLQLAEQRLHTRLPWELWELLRYRNGQTAAPGIRFADDAQLLSTNELHVVHLPPPGVLAPEPRGPEADEMLRGMLPQLVLSSSGTQQAQQQQGHEQQPLGQQQQQQQQQQAEQPLQPLAQGLAPHETDPAALHGQQGTAGASGAEIATVCFAENAGGSRCFCIAADGRVYLQRGFTVRMMAPSLSGFVQRLLL